MTEKGAASAYNAKLLDAPDSLVPALTHALAHHAHLSPKDRGAILDLPFVFKSLPAGSYLLREGDMPTHCALLVSGFAFRQKRNSDGARQILSLHFQGDMLDLQSLFLDVADYSVQTLTQADVAIIPKMALVELATKRVSIARSITTSLLIEASISREWLFNVGRRDARARIAHLLCEIGMRLNLHTGTESRSHDLPMTQDHLADALGLTKVHVNRTLRGLEIEGLLIRNGRSVSFPDLERLREVADFSPRYLHVDQQRS